MAKTEDEVAALGHQVVGAIADALNLAHQLTNDTGEKLDHIQTVRAKLQLDIHQLEGELAAIEPAFATSVASLHQIDNQIQHGGADLARVLGDLGSQIETSLVQAHSNHVQCVSAAEDYRTRSAEALQEFGSLVEHGVVATDGQRQQFNRGFEETETHINRLVQEIATVRDRLGGYIEELRGSLREHEEGFRGFVHQEVLSLSQSFLRDHSQKLLSFAENNVQSQLMLLQDDVRRKVSGQAAEMIEGMISGIAREFDLVARKIGDAKTHGSSTREVMQPLVGQVEELIKPIQEITDRIRDLLNTIGFSV